MICPRDSGRGLLSWAFFLTVLTLFLGGLVQAQPPAVPDDSNPGQFFTITEPITGKTLEQVRAATRQFVDRSAGVVQGKSPILVFEFRPGETAPGRSDFGASYDLAFYMMKNLGGAKTTVAYVPEPLKGYAVLAALACDEIVMGSQATLGPITPEDETPRRDIGDNIRALADTKVRDRDLLLGMVDRTADLRAIRTTDKQIHYVMADNLAEFKKTHQVLEDNPAWEGGQRGVITAQRARDEGFSKLTADNPVELAKTYRLSGRSTVDDPTLGQVIRPVWIKIDGPLDIVKKSYLVRRIEQARQEKVNLVFFEFNSEGGIDMAADAIADTIAGIKDMKTVAFINDRAIGVSILAALACNEIVFGKDSEMGDVRQLVVGRGQVVPLNEGQVRAIANRAANLAEQKGHPVAVARAMVDPEVEVVEATDAKTGAVTQVLQADIQAEPGRFLNPRVRKSGGEVLTVTAADAASYGLGQSVNEKEDFLALYGLRGKLIRIDGPTWVDTLVTVLTDPIVSWILLFVGLFMLVLELKLPGIGLPAITSALAFLLFFWSHYLSGTADQLEIILFLVGLICLALELFVFPGFGVFGMSGVLLILTSIVMASHTFVWPTQEYEYRELAYTLIQITVAMVAVGAGAVVIARYFPSLPLFNRLVLKPEPWTGSGLDDPIVKPSLEGYESLAYLIGETGRTTTMLRPSGKARFGDMLLDVTADGYFIEPDSLVEVIDVHGSRVTVKRLGA
ncbi:NfeD family protein [Singulisphaera acidiphila]|uniref:Membrane-bound serine protease (ClpP class) n=1 Tax=Singulisphaera acidiphila (strain ATCC BAA-1392 / DSM 18658 / VKM B-2454 / MOB10) TaxID=886293 RepID=L0D970_SINAD|nr:NfeD family protein [Singulisphaera acidiphila]AGA25797.1 membrane-bound serine protease (ClpP class) [Singulisphaera acidiphila DSM 18658]